MNAPIRVTIVDDHPLFAQGLKQFLQSLPVVESTNTAFSFQELEKQLKTKQPHFIFLDLNIPPTDGFCICKDVKYKYPEIFVAILSQYNSPAYINKAKECGADAYFVKNTDPEIISLFLNSYVSGHVKGFFEHVPDAIPSAFKQDDFERRELLTKREQEVLNLLSEGLPHGEIEERLSITYSTYKIHRANILHKLNLKNDFELGQYVLQHPEVKTEGSR